MPGTGGRQSQECVPYDPAGSSDSPEDGGDYFYCGKSKVSPSIVDGTFLVPGCSGAACSPTLGCSKCPAGRTLYQFCAYSTACVDCGVRLLCACAGLTHRLACLVAELTGSLLALRCWAALLASAPRMVGVQRAPLDPSGCRCLVSPPPPRQCTRVSGESRALQQL